MLNISIKGRLYTSLFAWGVGITLLVILSLFFQYNSLMDAKKTALRQNVEIAVSIINKYNTLAKDGNISIDEAKKASIDAIKNLRYNGKEYFWINDMGPKMVMHPFKQALDGKDLSNNKDPKGKTLFIEMVQVVSANGDGYVSYYWPKPGMDEPVEKMSYVKGFSEWGWVVGSGVYIDDVSAQFKAQATKIVALSLLILIVMLVLTLFISISITKPIGMLEEIASNMASGEADLTKRLNIKTKDEIGKACGAIDTFIEIIQNSVKNSKSTSVQNASIAYELSSSANQIGVRSEDSAKIITEVAKESKEIMSAIASSMDDSRNLEIGLVESKESLLMAQSIVEHIANSIHQSAQTEQDMAISLEQLSGEADQVKQVLTIISDIADQTNLLALNAAIEAARAGEHGRGFAVVADEVRKLAERTQKSLAEINATINTIVQSINTATEQMAHNATAISQLVTESNKVTENISSSSDRLVAVMKLSNQTVKNSTVINEESRKISEKTEKAMQIISSNAASTEEIAAAISHLHQLTETLSDELSKFKV